MIQGHGNSTPQVIFVQDGGSNADRDSNLAISGYAGRVISGFCKSIGVDYAQQYNTALIKDVIRFDPMHFEENAKRIPEFSKILFNEIEALSPHVIVPLGELGFRHLTGYKGIRKFRGSVLAINPVLGHTKKFKVMPILGPNPYLYQQPELKYVTEIDFAKLPKYLNDSDIPDNRFNIWICRNSTALRNYILRASVGANFLVFDIETFQGIPTCFGLSFDGNESVCVPILDRQIDFDSRWIMFQQIVDLMASDIPKVNQNIKFDWKACERWGIKINNVVGDTMLAASCIYSEFPKNLGFLTSIYTGFPYFKDEGKEFNPTLHNRDRLYLYNAKDAIATHQIYQEQLTEIKHFGLEEVYTKMMKLLPIYKKAEQTGIKVDNEKRENLLAKYLTLYEIEVLKIKNLINSNTYVNPKSPKQMSHLIFEVLGYDKIRGVKGTDDDSLETLKAFGKAKRSPIYGRDVLDCIAAARRVQKVIEFLELQHWPDGRYRGEFNLAGTENGRSSGSKTTDELFYFDEKGRIETEQLGHSLQTIGKHGFEIDGTHYGKEIREIFVADKGYEFIEIDLSQAEARVDAILAGNFEILKVFDTPVGIHRLTGSWVFNCDPSEIKKGVLIDGKERYHVAKQVRHAGERNITAFGLVSKLLQGATIQEGTKYLEIFHSMQPEIRGVFHAEIKKIINESRTLIAPNGRRRMFMGRIDDHLYNEAFSFLPQCIVSDQNKFAFIPTFQEFPKARLLVEAHDGHLALVPKQQREKYIECFQYHVEKEIDFRRGSLKRDFSLKIPSEAAFGQNWHHMEEIKK